MFLSVTGTDTQPETAGESLPPGSAPRPPLPQWQAQLRASAGFRAVALVHRVKRMGHLLQGNVAEYRALTARLQDPAVSLPVFDVRNADAHDDLLTEAERLLHNVLTAVSTRVDQQRRFMATHFEDDPVLTSEYLERVKAFAASTEAVFLKGLRNYITHRQLPVAQSRQSFTASSFEVTFVLPAAPLLDWDGWNSGTRAWITGQGNAVVVVGVVDAYARQADELDKWLQDRISLRYRTDIDDFLRRQEEYRRESDRVFGVA